MAKFKVIAGSYDYEKETSDKNELMLRRFRGSLKFDSWKSVISRDMSVAIAVVDHASWAFIANVRGYTLAHEAVAMWDSAAQKLLDNYYSAKSDQVVDISDVRIRVAILKDIDNVSVKELAARRLNTPLFLRRN